MDIVNYVFNSTLENILAQFDNNCENNDDYFDNFDVWEEEYYS